MRKRMTREAQTARNRSLLLGAARRVFTADGYHGATLERIAEEAGFSKGVVYSQFRSKADLFLALLEERIETRAEQNARVAEQLVGDSGVAAVLDQSAGVASSDPDWWLLVIEFRVHAARDPELNRRYSALHKRTIAGLASVFADVYERSGQDPPVPPRELAEVVFAVGVGVGLEQAADPEALGGRSTTELLEHGLTLGAGSSRAGIQHTADVA